MRIYAGRINKRRYTQQITYKIKTVLLYFFKCQSFYTYNQFSTKSCINTKSSAVFIYIIYKYIYKFGIFIIPLCGFFLCVLHFFFFLCMFISNAYHYLLHVVALSLCCFFAVYFVILIKKKKKTTK